MSKQERVKLSSQFVKTQTMTHAKGSHGGVHLVWKKKKSGLTSVYVRKMLKHIDTPQSAYIEAIAGEFYRYLDINLSPKVRVIKQEQEIKAVISKQIVDYKPANLLTSYEIQGLLNNKNNVKQFAQLLVGSYFYAEDDLNNGNWGVDGNGDIVKIDNDRSFCPISLNHCQTNQDIENKNILHVSRWPNTILTPEERWKAITIQDIENLPNIIDAKGSNWPKQLDSLASNENFIYWKYYYLTKLLLLDEYFVNTISESHSDDYALNQQITDFIISRCDKLNSILLNIESYRKFLSNNNAEISSYIEQDICEYNKSLINKNKSHLTINKSKQLKKLAELHNNCREIDNNPNTEQSELLCRLSCRKTRHEICKSKHIKLDQMLKKNPYSWTLKHMLQSNQSVAKENMDKIIIIQDKLSSGSWQNMLTQIYNNDITPKTQLMTLNDPETLKLILKNKKKLIKFLENFSGLYQINSNKNPVLILWELSLHYKTFEIATNIMTYFTQVNSAELLDCINSLNNNIDLSTLSDEQYMQTTEGLRLLIEVHQLFTKIPLNTADLRNSAYRDLIIKAKNHICQGEYNQAKQIIMRYKINPSPMAELVY